MLWRHSHRWVNRWWRSWSVWCSSRTGVVLATSPGKSDAGVANRVALHLVDSHLGSMSLNELDEAATLARWDLDVGNLSESLEEGAEFILCDVARETADEDRGIVWVGELVHRLRCTIITHGWSTHGVHAHLGVHALTLLAHVSAHVVATAALILWSGRGDPHWAITTVNALHLSKSTLLVHFVGKSDESISTRHSADRISHDLSRLA